MRTSTTQPVLYLATTHASSGSRRQSVTTWKILTTSQSLKFGNSGFGLFHLCLNLIWAFVARHRGSFSQFGSLSHWFVVLDKARLGSQHPDYHTLLAALTQILHGIILKRFGEMNVGTRRWLHSQSQPHSRQAPLT